MIHALRKAMLAASCFLILCGPPAWAVPYTFTALDFPPVDIPGLGTFPVTSTLPTAINLQGQIVGSFFIPLGAASEQRMFSYLHGTFRQVFGASFPFQNDANDINDAGQIVGALGDGGFLLNVPFAHLPFGGDVSSPNGIFPLPTLSSLLKLDPSVGFFASQALKVNNQGLIYGTADFMDAGPEGFLYDSLTDTVTRIASIPPEFLPPLFPSIMIPGASSSTITDMNAKGWIVGSFTDSTGTHGFLGIPVPEPGTIVLLGSAVVMLLLKAAKRCSISCR